MEAVYLPGRDIRNQFYDLLRSPNPDEYERNYTVRHHPGERQPAVLLSTPCSRAICGVSCAPPRTRRADYKVNKAVPLLFGLMAVSLVATAADPAAAAAGAGARGCRGSAACSGFCSTSCSSAPATS